GWVFAGMYADDGISGLSIRKRDGFNRMVADVLDGKIDLILTKSLSRFARNTVDALTAIRSLKAAGVAVYFQKENINGLCHYVIWSIQMSRSLQTHSGLLRSAAAAAAHPAEIRYSAPQTPHPPDAVYPSA